MPCRNLDTTTLRSFVTVIDTGGVTRAAERLNLTQSAVSMQIKRLEEMVGQNLLERVGRGVRPTLEGEQLAGYARQILALNDELWKRMTAPDFEGVLTFGVPHDIIFPLIPDVLKRFSRDFPRIEIKLISSFTSTLKAMLHKGEVDIILTTERQVAREGEVLTRLRLKWWGGANGKAWRKRPLPYAFSDDCLFQTEVSAALGRAGIPWRRAIISNDDNVAIAALRADLSVMALLEGTGFSDHIEEIDHNGELPELPSYEIGLFVGQGEGSLAAELACYVREAYQGSALESPRKKATQ